MGRRTPDGGKSKTNMSTPQWVDIIIWDFSRTFVLITAFLDTPPFIYDLMLFLNVYNLYNCLQGDITGIIAHYRELLGDYRLVIYILNFLLDDIVSITVLYWVLLGDFWLWCYILIFF